MNRSRLWALTGALVVALVLAFALQDVIRRNIVIPLAYLWWIIRLYYSAFPQVLFWALMILIVVLMLMRSLNARVPRKQREERVRRHRRGTIEELAVSLERSREGIYLKWTIAHRLGKLARDLLIQRGDRADASVIAPLSGRDWHPAGPVDAYLEAGLNGSFANYPNPKWPFTRPEPTPLDLNVGQAVEFLESQMENYDRR